MGVREERAAALQAHLRRVAGARDLAPVPEPGALVEAQQLGVPGGHISGEPGWSSTTGLWTPRFPAMSLDDPKRAAGPSCGPESAQHAVTGRLGHAISRGCG